MPFEKSKLHILALSLFIVTVMLPCLSDADPLDNWHQRNPLPQGCLYYRTVGSGVTYGNNIFVFVGAFADDFFQGCALIQTSPDGVTWTSRNVGTTNFLNGVTYGDGTFVAVGNGLLTSPNGITWTSRNLGTLYGLFGVTYGNGTFVVVATGGTILQSDPINGNCTAMLSTDLSLHVPIISFNGAYLWGDATCVSATADGSVTCMVTNY